jgi:hypothetical protein
VLLPSTCAAGEEAQDSDQNAGTDKRDDNFANEVKSTEIEKSAQVTPDNSPYQTDNDIANTAIAVTADNPGGQPTGDQANNEPDNEILRCHIKMEDRYLHLHECSPLLRFFYGMLAIIVGAIF